MVPTFSPEQVGSRKRKNGHAYFFPGQFSDRAGAYYQKYGMEYTRKGMGRWFRNAIENARLCPTAQEFENKTEDLEALYHEAETQWGRFCRQPECA